MISQAVAKHLSTADSSEPPVESEASKQRRMSTLAHWGIAFQRGIENLKEEVAVLETQLAELEQKNLRSPVLLRKLGEYFGFGVAGKLGWARFKLNFKQEQLDRFKAQPEMLKVTA